MVVVGEALRGHGGRVADGWMDGSERIGIQRSVGGALAELS